MKPSEARVLLIGTPITAVAYPYGNYSAETIAAVRADGYDVGVTCDSPTTRTVDRLTLPRIEVKSWPVAELDRRLASFEALRLPC